MTKVKELLMAKKSLREEHKAVKDYTHRSKLSRDKKLKKVFHHAIPEEKEHARMFSGYLRGKK
jgi:hypothetical protein